MKGIRRQNSIAAALLGVPASLTGVATAHAADKPNIVFVLMDNLGYGEVGFYGGGILRGAATPRIDMLATKVKFAIVVRMPKDDADKHLTGVRSRSLPAVRRGAMCRPVRGTEL